VRASGRANYLGRMDDSLRDFAPHIVALIAGGLGTSLGLTYGTRTPRAQAAFLKTKSWVFGLTCLGLAAAGSALAFWIVRSLLAGGATGPGTVQPTRLLLLGVAIGIPLGLPGVVFAWSEAKRRDRASKKRREWVPTKDDRRDYAAKILRQILDVSPRPRTLDATIGGDGGTVLVFEGDIDSKEVERLTEALRADLSDVGFKRVEAKNGTREWWSRV